MLLSLVFVFSSLQVWQSAATRGEKSSASRQIGPLDRLSRIRSRIERKGAATVARFTERLPHHPSSDGEAKARGRCMRDAAHSSPMRAKEFAATAAGQQVLPPLCQRQESRRGYRLVSGRPQKFSYSPPVGVSMQRPCEPCATSADPFGCEVGNCLCAPVRPQKYYSFIRRMRRSW